MTAIQDGDFLIAGGAASSADTFITPGGAELEPGAENLTITGGGGDNATLLPGQFALTGYAIEGVPLPVQTLDAGSFAVGGEPVDLTANRLLQADAGAAALTGEDALFVQFAKTLGGETRVLVFDGFDLQGKVGRALSADTGSATLAGSEVTLASQKRFEFLSGSAVLTGEDVTLRKDNKIAPASGSFAFTGNDLNFASDKSLKPVTGTFSLTGYAQGFSRSVNGFTLDAGTLNLSGYDIEANAQKRNIEPGTGIYSLSGGVLNFALTINTVFGNYRPTSRRFNPGSHFYSVAQTIAGTETRRIWGNKSNDASLELEYENIAESVALDILRIYENSYGNYASFVLPDDTFAGASDQLRNEYRLSDTAMKWYFAEPPKVRSVWPGICTLSLRLSGKNSYQR